MKDLRDTRRGGRCEVSIVLPCFKAPSVAERSVQTLMRALNSASIDWEILLVDDGGHDLATLETLDSRVRVERFLRNRGKGAAVRAGMQAATGDVRIFTDIDLPFGADFVPIIRAYLMSGFHLVIGDRTLPDSKYHQSTKISRRMASFVFTKLVGTFVTGGFFDTQCGLKGIRGDVADALFPLLSIDRFAFDVELIYVALKHRLDIKRIPVQLSSNELSSVRIMRDGARGLRDVFSIKVNQLRGQYHSPTLASIVRHDFEVVQRASRHPRSAS